MVGKPNVPDDDVDKRDDLKGSAAGTPGLTPLDEEREASLADEGGASGAAAESQDLETLKQLASELPIARLPPTGAASTGLPSKTTMKVAIGIAVAGAAGLLAFRRWS